LEKISLQQLLISISNLSVHGKIDLISWKYKHAYPIGRSRGGRACGRKGERIVFPMQMYKKRKNKV